MWWPGLSKQLTDLVKRCPECTRSYPKQRAFAAYHPTRYPWQKVASDLFTLNGANYLIINGHGIYPEVIQLKTTTSQSIITMMKSLFAQHGILETVTSDTGPHAQYSSQELVEFATTFNFTYVTSSPHYPQSNSNFYLIFGHMCVCVCRHMHFRQFPIFTLRVRPLWFSAVPPAYVRKVCHFENAKHSTSSRPSSQNPELS